MADGLLIWWLAQIDCERILETGLDQALPPYIQVEFYFYLHRAGGGRLWTPKEIPLISIEWDDAKPLAKIASKAGGIVIRKVDVRYVAGLPGFISDTNLNLWMPAT